MRNRTLNLKKETLSELSASDLTGVVGAYSGVTCAFQCISGIVACFTGHRCPTLEDCFTGTTTTN